MRCFGVIWIRISHRQPRLTMRGVIISFNLFMLDCSPKNRVFCHQMFFRLAMLLHCTECDVARNSMFHISSTFSTSSYNEQCFTSAYAYKPKVRLPSFPFSLSLILFLLFYSSHPLYQLQKFRYRPFKRPAKKTLISSGVHQQFCTNN